MNEYARATKNGDKNIGECVVSLQELYCIRLIDITDGR